MAKRIDWLEQFANEQYKQMSKTASYEKIANQIIVDRSTYPNAKVGSLVDYDNCKYKIVDTKYQDKSGPGLLLEEVTAELNAPSCNGEIKSTDGTIPATSTSPTSTGTENSNANCGDCAPPFKGAKNTRKSQTRFAKKDEDYLDLDLDVNADDEIDDDAKNEVVDLDDVGADDDDADLKDSKIDEDYDELADLDDSKVNLEVDDYDYPDVVSRPGGVKPAPSAPIQGPGKKNVTDAPYHPTYDPGEQYALESLDEWQDAAERTSKAIEQEDAQDRTTVEGYFTWNQYIDSILDGEKNVMPAKLEDEAPIDEIDEDLPDDAGDDEDVTNIDADTEEDNEKADLVDDAVDSMLDGDEDENDSSIDDDADADADIPEDFNEDDSEENVNDSSNEDEDNEDFDLDADFDFDSDSDSDSDVSADDDEENVDEEDLDLSDDDVNDEDLDLPDENEDKKEAAINKSRGISRLAYKNR